MKEVKRIQGVPKQDYTIACLGCGLDVKLKYWGGELDYAYCCGYRYEMLVARLDVVVYPPEPITVKGEGE